MTEGADTEFHHSVFPNSIQQIALLGFPRFPIHILKRQGKTDANVMRKISFFFSPSSNCNFTAMK